MTCICGADIEALCTDHKTGCPHADHDMEPVTVGPREVGADCLRCDEGYRL